jgi:hypothetical protein
MTMNNTGSLRPFSGWIVKQLDAETLDVASSHLPVEEVMRRLLADFLKP